MKKRDGRRARKKHAAASAAFWRKHRLRNRDRHVRWSYIGRAYFGGHMPPFYAQAWGLTTEPERGEPK